MKIYDEDYTLHINDVPKDALFFDIETTGISPERSHMYLFGCIHQVCDDKWHFRQWLIEEPQDERYAITDINNYISKFKLLVHFNGNRFDIPYVAQRCAKLCIPDVISGLDSLDLYRRLHHTKLLFGIENTKQKTFERFTGLNRVDKFNGGELIDVYHDYQKTQSEDCLHMILLHNREDVLGMTKVLSLLPYGHLFDKNAHISSEKPVILSQDNDSVLLKIHSDYSYPIPVSRRILDVNVHLEGEYITLRIPLCHDELKYFFPHAVEYYYLPVEDMAVHKSVGATVDPAFRQQATRETCYIKRKGTFFRLPGYFAKEIYRPCYAGSPYAEFCDKILDDASFWNEYLVSLFASIRSLPAYAKSQGI